jgi:hypothetical protein
MKLITEIEESVQDNVERKLDDFLLKDQAHGEVKIMWTLVFVTCVSNFVKFLDLFRKTILRSHRARSPLVQKNVLYGYKSTDTDTEGPSP